MGNGLEARRGDSVEFDYVLRCVPLTRRSCMSGYYIFLSMFK